MLAAIAVNTVGLGLCVYAYSRPWQWDRGPLMVLRGASIILGMALLCTLAALLIEVPDARGVFVVLAFVALGVAFWRRRGATARRRDPLTSAAAAPDADQLRPRHVRPMRTRRDKTAFRSVTLQEIENMEVQ